MLSHKKNTVKATASLKKSKSKNLASDSHVQVDPAHMAGHKKNGFAKRIWENDR